MAYKLELQLFHFQVMLARNSYLIISNLRQIQGTGKEGTNRLTKRDYNNVFSFADASKFQIYYDATNTNGKTSSSTLQ